jgi:hypothetical protein
VTHEWTALDATNSGNPTTGVVNTNLRALVLGAPNSTAKLLRTLFWFQLTLAGTATGVAITPDWPLKQVCATAVDAQFAGDTTVPDPYGIRPSGRVISAPLNIVYANQSFASSQGSVVLTTGGVISSAGERLTPPGAGWQVAVGFTWNDDAGFVSGFGSNFRWHWRARLDVLWDV